MRYVGMLKALLRLHHHLHQSLLLEELHLLLLLLLLHVQQLLLVLHLDRLLLNDPGGDDGTIDTLSEHLLGLGLYGFIRQRGHHVRRLSFDRRSELGLLERLLLLNKGGDNRLVNTLIEHLLRLGLDLLISKRLRRGEAGKIVQEGVSIDRGRGGRARLRLSRSRWR